jgi:tungstate transport system ATP-binding protein
VLYELKRLKQVYVDRTVLTLEDLSLEDGTVIGLLGPNGAGKTTLLKIMALLTHPTSGEMHFQGRLVDYTADLVPLRRSVVLVQQQPILFTTTVYRNVAFPLKIRGTARGELRPRVSDLLEQVGMAAFTGAGAQTLSGGETQRVAMARALACAPHVILLDEPTANVDVENQIIIERIIREINQEQGISVVFTTHNMVQASRLADQVLYLYEGQVAQSAYENFFGGRIQMDEGGKTYCLIQDEVKLRVDTRKTGAVRIAIDPVSVKIQSAEIGRSPENMLRGRIIQFTDAGETVRALVDVGIPVSVVISKDDFRRIGATVGDQVWLVCPTRAVTVF